MLTFRLRGRSGPTVVLIAGSGCDHTHFDAVFEPLARVTTVLAYDRGGLGSSPPVDGGGDGLRWRTAELHDLLEMVSAKTPRPYVLVGHSLGALIAQLYAVDHPKDIAGIVSIDGDDGIPTDLPPWPALPPAAEAAAMAQLLRNLPEGVAAPMPPEPQHLAAVLAENQDRDAGLARLAEARAAGKVPDVPFVHIGATDHAFGPPELLPVSYEVIRQRLREKHERTARAYPQGRFVEASRSGHYVQFDEPDLVVDTIRAVVGR